MTPPAQPDLFRSRPGPHIRGGSAFGLLRNGFREAVDVERRGLDVVLPFLRSRAFDGQIVHIAKGDLAAILQRSVGDVLISIDGERFCSVEIKVERVWTGNLFLETWSNRNLESKAQHAERGSNPGWLVTSKADVLLYHFLDVETAVLVSLFRLQRWAFASGETRGIYAWPERQQRRYGQRNDTWGRLVPVMTLEEHVGARVMQIAGC